MDSWVLWLELAVGLIVSSALLAILIWAIKQGQFDDSKKVMNRTLFDSVDDLNDAINKETKIKKLKEKKAKNENRDNI
jgi:cbb3-type cytochrome oxidase maturation protein